VCCDRYDIKRYLFSVRIFALNCATTRTDIFPMRALLLLLLPLPSASFQSRHQSSFQSTALRSIPGPLDTLTSGLASLARLQAGVTVDPNARTSVELVELYDMENNPDCRVIRERITELDLTVKVAPSFKNVPRLKLRTEIGQEVLVSGLKEIMEYLGGETEVDNLEAIRTVGNYVATALRWGRGSSISPAAINKVPAKALILYSYEGNQFCRLVREVLTELNLPYELRSTGKESPRRRELSELTGGYTQCPYLVDPNTDTSMSESADIVAYLYQMYAKWTPPNELLQLISGNVMVLGKPLFAMLAPLQAGKQDEDYDSKIVQAQEEIDAITSAYPVVVFTYSLSPFSSETRALLDRLKVEYQEVSLGAEWIPGLLSEPAKRAALLQSTGQSSLPHIFVNGKSIGGLFSGTPGLVPALEDGSFEEMLTETITS